MKYFKIIEHLSSEKATEKDLNDFNLQLINNPALRNEYDNYIQSLQFLSEEESTLRKAIIDTSDFKFSINASFDSLPTDSGDVDERTKELSSQIRAMISTGRNNRPNRFNGWLKAAAIFIFIFLVTLPASQSYVSSPVVISLSTFKPLLYIPVITRGNENYGNSISIAWDLYTNREIDSALMVLNRMGYSPELEADWIIFKSVCLMEKHDFEGALDVLDKLPNDCVFRMISLWYKTICHINLKKNEEAISQLDEIARIDSINKKSARKLQYLLNTYPLLEINFAPSEFIQNGIKGMSNHRIKTNKHDYHEE